MVAWLSGPITVEDFVQCVEEFPLTSSVEDTAALSPQGVMGYVETPWVRVSKVQELEKALEGGKTENDLFAGSLHEYQVPTKDSGRQLEEEQLKSPAPLRVQENRSRL